MNNIKSTPISSLPSDYNENSDNNQLVNEILKELESQDTLDQNPQMSSMPPMPQQMQQGRMPQQMQQGRMPQQMPQMSGQDRMTSNMDQEQMRQEQMRQEQMRQEQEQAQNQIQEEQAHNLEQTQTEPSESILREIDPIPLNLTDSEDLNKILLVELKRPLIIIALCIAFSLPALNKTLLNFIPKLATENGDMSLIGIIVKAILVGILFYITDKFFN